MIYVHDTDNGHEDKLTFYYHVFSYCIQMVPCISSVWSQKGVNSYTLTQIERPSSFRYPTADIVLYVDSGKYTNLGRTELCVC